MPQGRHTTNVPNINSDLGVSQCDLNNPPLPYTFNLCSSALISGHSGMSDCLTYSTTESAQSQFED